MATPLAVSEAALVAVRYIHYLYPPALFVWFIASQGASVCSLSSRAPSKKTYQKRLFILLQILIIASYVAEAVLMYIHSLVEQGWWASSDNVIYILTSILVWGAVEVAILDTEKPVWYPYYGSWLFSLVIEGLLLTLSASTATPDPNKFETARFLIEGCRIFIFLAMPLGVYVVRERDLETVDQESTRLLGQEATQPSAYGSMSDSEDLEDIRNAQARMLKKIDESGNWWTYAKSFAIFWPYMWPYNERWLQFSMVMVGMCLVIERGLNVLVPHQLGIVTNSLLIGDGNVPWIQVLLYIGYRWLDSASGISALQSYLWVPIDQYSHRALTTAAYNHVMSLSYDFHSNKRTGEVWTSITQGRSVNGFIDTILFQVLPMLADLCVAFAYFFILFDAYMALIVAVVSVVYLWATTKLSAMRNDMRRNLNESARSEVAILIETISSWTTVSYFNRIPYEQNRYLGAMKLYQVAERKWLIGISVLGATQSLIFTLGLLAASFLAVYEVTRGIRPVGSFVTLLSYWAQLSGPLSFFANFYRKVQIQLLDAERLLELFETKATVADELRAIELENVGGCVDFEKVCFSYDSRKPAITDVSFHVPPGTTVAFVGETGGGKTTCLKLLFRFYDVQSGCIKIDGHDIRDIKLSSLREHMGVVPQDPQLFNDTIMSNIKYANFEATDEDVYEACRAASIHEKILSFPDGYLSKVGERGVRLSGGELQRVSIARAILKNPKIILLDEATSMIDMETERQIQDAFKRLSKGRTMFIVAHRLSTIMNADQIIVIKEGKIVEKGNHKQLLDAEGKYFQLWSRQSNPDKPPVKTNMKTPLLIEDLFNMSANDEGGSGETLKNVAPSSQTSDKIQIPEISKRRSRTLGAPTVAFSLPERTVWGPGLHFQPSVNPRTLTPNHGILKNASQLLELYDAQEKSNPTSKPASFLKPDAREFVPRGVSTVEHGPTKVKMASEGIVLAADSDTAAQPSTSNEMFANGTSSKQKGAESSKVEILPEATSSDVLNAVTIQEEDQTLPVAPPDDVIKEWASTGEVAGKADPEINNPQDTKKRRRRIRRKNNKLKSGGFEENPCVHESSCDGVESGANMPAAAVSPTSAGDEGPRVIDIETTSSMVGNGSKSKRQFRSGTKPKNNSLEPGTHAPLSPLPILENGPTVFNARPETELSHGNGTKRPWKEGQPLQENNGVLQQSGSVSKHVPMQHRNYEVGKFQEQAKGTWRKGHKKPKSLDSGNSANEP